MTRWAVYHKFVFGWAVAPWTQEKGDGTVDIVSIFHSKEEAEAALAEFLEDERKGPNEYRPDEFKVDVYRGEKIDLGLE